MKLEIILVMMLNVIYMSQISDLIKLTKESNEGVIQLNSELFKYFTFITIESISCHLCLLIILLFSCSLTNP